MSNPNHQFHPNGMAIAIGSLPFSDTQEAVEAMINCLSEAPAWPQLPKRSFKENMYVQYSKNMPGVVIDEENEKMIIDPSKIDELENFYQKYLDDDVQYFELGKDFAAGFYSYLDKIKSLEKKPEILKGHVTGPVSFGLTVKQPNDQSIIYDENYFDAILKTLVQKARYQVKKFNDISPTSRTLILFDEPYLVSFGSAFVSLNKEDVIGKLNECFDTVDGLTGIHVCGGTDWAMIMETNVDVIHFDAFDYFESMSAYPSELKSFLDKGGMIGWGITPHTAKVMDYTPEGLFNLLESRFDRLCDLGLERKQLYESSFVATSCGTGTMTQDQAVKALQLSSALTELIRKALNKC